MILHRVTIGILLNKKMFRLSSVGGVLTDEILTLKDSSSDLGKEFFTKVTSSNNIDEIHVTFLNDDESNRLHVQTDQFVLRKTATDEGASVSVEKAIHQLEVLWKKTDKIIKLPEIRRIGIVAEYRSEENKEDSAANELISSFLTVSPPKHSGRFQLTYEDRELNTDGSIPDKESGDFWNTIYTYYLSEKDETPESGKIVASIDVQKYYNPAKSNLAGELKNVKKRFVENKSKFKASLKKMGIE